MPETPIQQLAPTDSPNAVKCGTVGWWQLNSGLVPMVSGVSGREEALCTFCVARSVLFWSLCVLAQAPVEFCTVRCWCSSLGLMGTVGIGITG